MSGRDPQDVLERAEERRRAVVAAAVELRQLGCGDVFEEPLDPPEPDHASRRDRIAELVDEIMVRTTHDVREQPIDPAYRYSWTHYPAQPYGAQVVVETPAGPVTLASGVYTSRQEGPPPLGRSSMEDEEERTQKGNRRMRRLLDELHEQKGSEPELRQEVHEELRNLVRCPDCDALLYRVGSFGDGGPFLLVMCSNCPWRGALYEDGGEGKERARQRMVEGLTHLEKEGDIGELAEAWRILEEQVAEALEGWECMTEEQAREAGARVFHHLDTGTMLRISYIMGRRAIPWTSSSSAALNSAVHALDLGWEEGKLKRPLYIDTPHGRVSARSELERLQEAAEEWEGARDG